VASPAEPGRPAHRPVPGGPASPPARGEPPPSAVLPAAFYARPVLEVAPDLVGCTLTHGDTTGVIVESEAYHQSEPACHAYVGVTPRTRILFGPPGTAYVYRSYGIHALFNAVCDAEGVGAAVLIRALEPVRGIERMRERRGLTRLEQLCSGPGKLTEALDIELEHNGTDLVAGRITIGPRPPGWEDVAVVAGPRIGITKATDLPWRFCALGSRSVSRPWPPGAAAVLRRNAA
jgi:DNA-3-methyladenine glycosylase